MAKGKRKKRVKKRVRTRLVVAVALVAAAVLIALVAVFSVRALRRAYPLRYTETVRAVSEEFGVDPYLVCAMIFCESSFRADAESPAGALGLMQIMPSTGEWIAGKLDIEGYSSEMLLEPELNVRIGAWYLSFLLKRYDGVRENALAAYNAGHGNVDSWLSDSEYSSEGRLTEIPFAETAEYVRRVTTAYEKYRSLYKKEFEG